MSTRFTRSFVLSAAIGVLALSGCAAREKLELPAPIDIPNIAVPDVSTPDINIPETRDLERNGQELQRALVRASSDVDVAGNGVHHWAQTTK